MSQTKERKGIGRRVQVFGSFLSGMIMPNIDAFIAQGFIATIFIDNGWFPNRDPATLAGSMITYLIPLLIAFSGGRLIYDLYGGIIAAAVTMRVIVTLPDTPILLGAMIIGPLAGWLMKEIDRLIQPGAPQGFEVLLNNFSAGILGFITTIAGFKILVPLTRFIIHILSAVVEALVRVHLLPLVSILIESVKVVLLNNVINHDMFTSLGVDQTTRAGQSTLYTIESNPGPGLEILLTHMILGKGTTKATPYGAGTIHFFGGIHEIYFPYVSTRPLLFVAVILSGIAGVATYQATGLGLKSPASPGLFIVYCLNAPRDEFLHMLLDAFLATLVSLVVAVLIMKFAKESRQDLEAATAQTETTKGKKSNVASKLVPSDKDANTEENASGNVNETSSLDGDPEALLDNYSIEGVDAHNYNNINHIIFACDTDTGPSVMGASMLRNKSKRAGINDITATNTAIDQLSKDTQLATTQKKLTDRAIKQTPDAIHISADSPLNSPKYGEPPNNLKKGNQA